MEEPEGKHLGLLIESFETKPFQTLVSMCRPKKLNEVPMRDIVRKLDVAYNLVTFKVTQWSHFFAIKQQNDHTLVQTN